MKTGRNDPCPCGSGKKFKKCCIVDQTVPVCTGLSPAEIVEARRRAFDTEDFGFIYDSYHPDSPFRQHFPDRRAYLAYAQTDLRGSFAIQDCRILRQEELSASEAQVLFYLDIRHNGERLETVELSRFTKHCGAWLYHSGCKVSCSDLSGPPEAIEPAEVERLSQGICF